MTNARHYQIARKIVEGVLGRPLKTEEVVHHVNGDPSDNRHCNLCAMERGEHYRLHAAQRKAEKDVLDAARLSRAKPVQVPAYTVTAAAKRLAVTRPTVYAWLKEGKLIKAEAVGATLIDAASVDLLCA